MATGGIFQLITNDGKQDRMLMASALLASRIATARNNRKCAGQSDCTPTLYDIERTHILFTSAHFKPFAAIGYEYNKVTPTAGTVALNENSTQSVTFSIPQFGDFFCDMVVHVTLEQPTMTYDSGVEESKQNLFRWCHYPGERLLKRVKFEVNGNPLDEYTSDAVNFHREFLVQPNKELGWSRCMGQEEMEEGWVDQPNWENNGTASSAVTYRTKTYTASGLQTPTGPKTNDFNNDNTTDKVELFIPLLFWCNKDPRLAVPSVAIPYGQRFITLELAPWRELVGVVPRGHSDTDLVTALANPDPYGKLVANDILKNIELYINNIFVNPEVHNIFIKRIGFTLIRVHRQQNNDDSDGSQDKSQLLQNLKWPIEAIFVGMRIKSYSNGSPTQIRNNLDKWHKFHKVICEKRSSQGWCSGRMVLDSCADDAFKAFVVPSFTGTVAAPSGGDFTAPNYTDFTGVHRIQFGDLSSKDGLTNKSNRVPLRLYFETLPELKNSTAVGGAPLSYEVIDYNLVEDFLPKLFKPNDILTFTGKLPDNTTKVDYKLQVSRLVTGVWETNAAYRTIDDGNGNAIEEQYEELWHNVNKGYVEFCQYDTDLNGNDVTPLFARVQYSSTTASKWYETGDANLAAVANAAAPEETPGFPSNNTNDSTHQVWYPNQPSAVITTYHKRVMGINLAGSAANGSVMSMAGITLAGTNDVEERLKHVGYAFLDVSGIGASNAGALLLNMGNTTMEKLCIWHCSTAAVESCVSLCRPTLEYITIKAHGIPIYNKFPAQFYNAYIPYNYGGHNIRVPKDCGAMMITFCLYPGTYQPSGHINVSRAREFYIDYKTTGWIGNDPANNKDPGTLVIVASAINFLLISDGSAVLRYST
jgi:hypothetical protein